jgi:hypothetical protein
LDAGDRRVRAPRAHLGLFNAFGGGSPLGFPISDVTDVVGLGGTAGQLARFAGGTAYWSPTTGACAVQGVIRDRYDALGGPASEFGFPTTHETAAGAVGVRYNGFQHGVIAWSPATGVVGVCDLELHLGWVRSGPVDDGPGDSSAELVTYTTVRVNGQALETNVRRPGGHAGTSHNLDARYAVPSVRFHTTVTFEVKVDDWDRVTSNDYLGTFRRTLDVSTLWGLAEPGGGVFVGVPLSQKGSPARSLTSVRLDFAVRATRPAAFDPNRPFREQSWWRFANFSTAALSKQQYADTFRDVGHRTNWVEKAVHPWDSLFYLAYEGLAAKGNCFGMSLEGALAATGRSLYGEPVYRFGFDGGLGATVNHKHGYQLGDASVRWILAKLATLDAVRPAQVYAKVQAAIARRDWPLVSMFELAEFRGHTVLAYECPPAGPGQPLVIRVADPNHPHAGGAPHPTWIEIDPAADTFKFVTPNGVTFQSTRILHDFLPGTLMFETPVSRVAGHPRTPFWEFAALLAAVGGLIVVAGDAEAAQVTADGAPLYATDPDGARAVAPGGAGGWMRVPLFDHTAAAPPQLFANLSRPTERLELALRGRGAGGGRHYLRTPRHAVLLEGPADAAAADTLRVLRAGGAEPRVELDTAGGAKEVTLGLGAVVDAGRRESVGALVRLGAAPGMTASVQGLAGGPGVVVRSAGEARPLHVELEVGRGDDGQRVAFVIPAELAGEAVAVRPEDPASPMGEMRLERVDSEGKPAGGAVRVQPRPVDPRRSGLATLGA